MKFRILPKRKAILYSHEFEKKMILLKLITSLMAIYNRLKFALLDLPQ